jgi:hypothetical protein
MRLRLDIAWDVATAVDLLNALVRANVRLLRAMRLPLLALSGVVYQAEPWGQEVWLDATTCLSLGVGDCEDLAAWRAAELLVYGEQAILPGDPGEGHPGPFEASVFLRDQGGGLYHAMVRVTCSDGHTWIEDPSAMLGMRGVPRITRERWRLAGVTPRVQI